MLFFKKSIYGCIYIYTVLLIAMLSCSNDNGVSPNDIGSRTVTIICVDEYFRNLEGMQLKITENGVFRTEEFGIEREYRLECEENIKYVFSVSKKGYVCKPDSMVYSEDEKKTSYTFYMFDEKVYESIKYLGVSVIIGRIQKENGIPVSNVQCIGGMNDVKTNYEGFFKIYGCSTGKTVTFNFRKTQYSFKPDSIVVVPDEPVEIIDIKANYNGPPVHSVSGISCVEGIPGSGLFVFLKENGVTNSQYITEKNGEYIFYDLPDGLYTLFFQGYKCDFKPDSLRVVIKGKDVNVETVNALYHGYTWYSVSGRVIDRSGNCMVGVKMNISQTGELWLDLNSLTTGPDGMYAFDERVGAEKDGAITFRPEKEGCVFSPDSVTVNVQWKNRTIDGGALVVPDIIGTDYTVYIPTDHFPLSPTASWTYARSTNSGAPVEHVMAVSGAMLLDGAMYRTFEPEGPAGVGAYRVDGAGVCGVVDGRRMEVFRFGVVPGTVWEVPRATSLGKYKATFRGVEDVSVPTGKYADCMKYELRTGGAASYETWTVWFAKGVGMVRQEHTLVNYGEVIERVTDGLKRHVK